MVTLYLIFQRSSSPCMSLADSSFQSLLRVCLEKEEKWVGHVDTWIMSVRSLSSWYHVRAFKYHEKYPYWWQVPFTGDQLQGTCSFWSFVKEVGKPSHIALDCTCFHTLNDSVWMINCGTFVCQIIDPYVEVEVIGLPVDCAKSQTKTIQDNGKRLVSWLSATFVDL